MKKMQGFVLFLVLLMTGYSASLRAEDIDIYVDNAGTAGTPNVLFVIDTGANFSSSAAVPCTAYASGGAPSLGNTAGGIEQCALVDAIEGLADSVVNIGILVNNNNNFATDVRAATDAAYHETCSGTYGGCVIRKLTLMTAANKASLVNFIKSWKTSGSDSATEFNVKSGGDRTANMMQEAWAYYNGKTGMSGKAYGTSILANGCQKNFVVFIGNAFNTSGTPADSGVESPYNGTNALTSAQVAATDAQKLKISETVNFVPNTCGVSSIAASTNASNWSENWADEWARLMFQQDAGATTAEGAQNIITYSIGVVNDASCKPDYPALLSTMAKYGGGKYFKTSTSADIKAALDTVLNEVQAVNSVFSSASLPVSVNAEGSYLNQIYLGMFRPDATGSPRWLGNLKQYQLIRNSTGDLVMGDAAGKPAISSAGTGFISPNALSFWTQKDTSKAPDDPTTGGFWKNDLKGVPPSAYDSPDGEVVEKGGVSQQLRLENLTSTFTGAGGSASNPRRMYTYCPSGTSCVAALTDSTNEFSTANSAIAAAAFGSSSTVPIVSIVRTGTSALVTTNGNHGFTTGTVVTISNAAQNEYNVTQAITVNSATTFTITGLPDFPTTPSTAAYTVSSVGSAPASIVSITRSTSTTGGNNSEVATVVTSTAHGFTTASNIAITGASPSAYNYTGLPSAVSTNSFTFSVAIEPPSSPSNTYQAAFSAAAYPAKTVTLSKSATNVILGSTSAAHGFWVGQTIKVSGSPVSSYNGSWTIATVPTITSFTASGSGLGNPASSTGSVSVDTTAKTVSLSRVATTDSALATATGAPSLFFGSTVGGTRTLNITKASGSATNEAAYVQSNVMVTCLNTSCTSFTYPITVTPSSSATGTMVAALSGSSVANISAGNITRASSGTTATVSGVPASMFANGQSVNIAAASGTPLSSEAAYVGAWTISCAGTCTSFTFGPVTLTPATPATGSNMQAYSDSSPPDKDTIVKWVRGADNYGDEKGPGLPITVRPSIHGDVLHSRPLVVNYGDARGIVVFYGSNDGVYRAVNGNQTASINSIPAGDELWGLVLPEQYGDINRQRLASPELKFPATTLASAQPKDYFVDGPTGAYQKLTSSGTVDKAYIYLTMRRGGRFIYALDVSTPTAPTVLWKIDSATAGFEELGQTWSRPRVTLLQRSASETTPTPVLIFGAGYDAAEDTEPPGTDSMGRGIYIVNAVTGALIWSANSTCTTSATCRNVPGMKYAIPSDIAFVDRDGNGYSDKLYFGDTGGNIWRADVSDASSSNWTVTKLAALGCNTGTCPAGTTPRKFFFPPSVLTIKTSGTTGSYDAISLASGDREHPLKSTASGSSYGVNDRFFMIMDTGTALATPVTNNVTPANLFNATSTVYDGTLSGFYISFATGEKAVNAPLAVNGSIYFATNRPIDRSATCSANLGEAKAYAVNPFFGTQSSNVLAGGGMPPSAVSGLITVTSNGTTSTEKFCIGCGNTTPPPDGGGAPPSEPPCSSALENCTPATTIPKNLRRTYWYKK